MLGSLDKLGLVRAGGGYLNHAPHGFRFSHS
jgi:hypothetical protein